MGIGSISGSSVYTNMQIPESSISRPEGFEGSSKDVFVRDDSKELSQEKEYASAGRLFMSKHKGGHKGGGRVDRGRGPQGPGNTGRVGNDEVNMYPNRAGYDRNFLGKELPMPTLGDSIKDKVAMRTDKPGECELTYTNFSVVMNKERKQCFFTICNIDGSNHSEPPRNGSWQIDGRIPRDCQLGNEAYSNNDIDKGHMVRRLDPCWGSQAQQANLDSFSYCNATLQHADLNQKEWLELENHVLDSCTGARDKYTVITGPIFSDDDPKFNNHGRMKEDTQIPMKFFKTVVWADDKTGELRSCSFVLSQEDIINRDGGLFKSKEGFEPGRFSIYQVPQSQLEQMTDLHFGNIGDITADAVKLTASNGYTPQGL